MNILYLDESINQVSLNEPQHCLMRSCSPGDVVVSQHALGGRGVASRGCGRREGLTQEAGGADMVLHVLRVR